MLIHLEVAHYKSLSDVSVRFRPLNIIVGPNGSGKSNLVDVVSFLHDCAVDDIDTAITKRHGIDSIRQWSKTRPYNIIINTTVKNPFGWGRYKLILASNRGTYRILEESGEWHGRHPRPPNTDQRNNIFSGAFSRQDDGRIYTSGDAFTDDDMQRSIKVSEDSLFITQLNARIPILGYMFFRPLADELSSFSTYSIYPNTLRHPQVVSRDAILSEDGSNLATVLKRINSTRTKRDKDDLISALKVVLPICQDVIVRSAGGYYVPVIRVAEPSGDLHDFNLSQISDGTLRVLGLLTSFYQPVGPAKIAIEEPEQMIHPGALPVIADAAKDFISRAARGMDRQVFITTHSPTLIDMFAPENIIWSKFKNGVTDCGSVSQRQLQLIKDQLFSAGEILISEGFF